MKVKIGEREFELGSRYVTEMRDSNDIVHDEEALRQRMSEDGYLLIRGFHNRDDVLAARKQILERMQEMGRIDPNFPLDEGVIAEGNRGAMFQGLNKEFPALLDVVNSPRAFAFFDRFLDGQSMTYDFKWTRAVPQGDYTGAHYDIVYMGRGTKNVYTLWTPLGDISYEMGGLAICLGSQHFDKIKQTYGQMDVDRDNVDGWFSTDPMEIVDNFGAQWATTEFRAGDAIIFGMFLMHGSLTNQTNRQRLSVDVRFQLASEPVDERWVGEKPLGHYAWMKSPAKSMEEARKQWGL